MIYPLKGAGYFKRESKELFTSTTCLADVGSFVKVWKPRSELGKGHSGF